MTFTRYFRIASIIIMGELFSKWITKPVIVSKWIKWIDTIVHQHELFILSVKNNNVARAMGLSYCWKHIELWEKKWLKKKEKGCCSGQEMVGIVLAGSACLLPMKNNGFVRSHLSLPRCVFLLQEFLILLEEFLVIKPSPLWILPLVFPTPPHPTQSLTRKSRKYLFIDLKQWC